MSLLAFLPGTSAWRARREDVLCRRTYQRLQEIVDGEVPPGPDTAHLVDHLDRCAKCTSEREAFEQLKEAVQRLGAKEGDEIAERLSPVVERLLHGRDTDPAGA